MSVNSYLTNLASELVLNGTDELNAFVIGSAKLINMHMIGRQRAICSLILSTTA